MSLRLVYFASVRERIGRSAETLDVPPSVERVGDLVAWLRERGEEYAAAFADGASIRAAIDHAHVKPDAPLAGAREVAFFPPMTGG